MERLKSLLVVAPEGVLFSRHLSPILSSHEFDSTFNETELSSLSETVEVVFVKSDSETESRLTNMVGEHRSLSLSDALGAAIDCPSTVYWISDRYYRPDFSKVNDIRVIKVITGFKDNVEKSPVKKTANKVKYWDHVNCLRQVKNKIEFSETIQDKGIKFIRVGVGMDPRKTRKMVGQDNLFLDNTKIKFTAFNLQKEKTFDFDVVFYHKIKHDSEFLKLKNSFEDCKRLAKPTIFCNDPSSYYMFRDRRLNLEYMQRLVTLEEFRDKYKELQQNAELNLQNRTVGCPPSFIVKAGSVTQEVDHSE